MKPSEINRREFLRKSSLAAGMAAAPTLAAKNNAVSIVSDSADPIAGSEPAKWAAGELQNALSVRGITARIHPALEQAPQDDFTILVSGFESAISRQILKQSSVTAPKKPESAILVTGKAGSRQVLLASGSDTRGVVYSVTELADRARYGADPVAALAVRAATVETAANRIRSIARCFESDVEDKSWFYDRAMWSEYLSMLATQRLNRFSMTFGLGYNYPHKVSDVYFYFTYPFLLSVPGYDVRVKDLSDAERKRNLETLQFIGQETVRRGLQFQVGLWTHAYEGPAGSQPNYIIEGITKENHAAYCRDALNMLLEACPAISGLTFRIHGESGIPEGDFKFWETVFQGIVKTGRKIEIDMHAKGMEQKMIDVALATGMPVNLSPKYWAEHMGLGYHQAAIRELEMPPKDPRNDGLFLFSNGSRKFLRYGYGDLLKEDRRYGILHRIWPGTQRVLLWGDPAAASAYGRTASLCGSDGVEWCEPLSFKGRMGSGLPGGRCGYADTSLNPKYDWQKFDYTYRVWGRLTYNPSANPDGWRRYLSHHFQAGAMPAEAALANASRVMLLLTTAHDPSASNNAYWPEMYTNMPIVDAGRKQPYSDTPSPKIFGNVSPLDPQLFSRIDDFATELLKGEPSGKYSPLDVAQWLEDANSTATRHWSDAEKRTPSKTSPEFRRMAADVAIQAGSARFFAWKMRSAVLWELYQQTGDKLAADEAVKAYRKAREAWAEFAARAKPVYAADITYGMEPYLRGHWSDRLPAIDEDLADMQRLAGADKSGATHVEKQRIEAAIRAVLSTPRHPAIRVLHTPAERFQAGEPLSIEVSLGASDGRQVRLNYRHVNQAETWQSAAMEWRDNRYRAIIPAAYTRSPYPLQYYFQLRETSSVTLYPGFEPNLANQPYFIVRQ